MGNRVTQSHLSKHLLERGATRSVRDKAYCGYPGRLFLWGARSAGT